MWSVFSVTYFDNHDQNTLSVNFDEHFKESHEVISFTLSHLNNSLLHSSFYFTISNSLRSRCELLIGDPRGGGARYEPPPPWSKFFHFHAVSVADPGFPRGGGANFPEGGAPTYEFAKFSQKLHEIERFWTPRGGAGPSRPPSPLDPPLTVFCKYLIGFCITNPGSATGFYSLLLKAPNIQQNVDIIAKVIYLK